MALYFVPGRGVVDSDTAHIPEYGSITLPGGQLVEWGTQGIERVPEYNLSYQFTSPVQWRPDMGGATPAGVTETAPGYISALLQSADAADRGELQGYQQEYWNQLREQALAVPTTRDVQNLRFEWAPEGDDWANVLGVGSPDLGAHLLGMRERINAGTATPHEQALYTQLKDVGSDWEYRANVPQASDVGFGLGDNLTGALGVLALGATGGLAAAPLFAGGAGLATTLGSLGTLSGLAGTGAGILGGATGQEWLSKAGLGLGALGGILGGVGGLANLWGTGVQSLSDAARLASSAGKITGALGSASGSDALRQAGRYLGQAGQLGSFGAGVLPTSVTDWSGDSAPWAANVAPGVSNLLSAADMATQRGGSGMEWDYSNDWGASAPYDNWSWDAGATSPSAWDTFTGWGDPYGPGSSGDAGFSGEGSGGWLSTLGGLAGAAGKFLGSNASWLGPAASALGGIGAGALGSRASSDAAALQAAALNRGIDLSTSQWLEQLARTAPWVQAGQQALGSLQGLAGQQLPGLPGATPAVSGAQYGLPSTTPGWNPQMYQGPAGVDPGAYRWTPQQGPQAANYRYTPGQIPSAATYRYTPGAVPTLSGQELLANDPGVAFRLAEGRKALEASALARGSGMSGSTLAALQRQGQELSSQEYGNAWNRASQQAQLREQWGQAASQMGWQQAEGEARLREQVNQIASQQNWTQAQAEAVFREQQAQLASQQGWTQALQGQQNAFNQGLDTSKWNTLQQQQYAQEQYKNMLEQSKWRYGQDVSQNETDYLRQQALYKQQLAQHLLPWDQYSTLAQLGGQMTGQLGGQGVQATSGIANLLGQLGNAQAGGQLGSGQSWMSALGNVGNAVQGGLQNNALLSALAGLNR